LRHRRIVGGMEFTGRICAIDHAGLHVRDLQRSLWFYGDVLGLPSLPRPDLGFPGAWLRIGVQELHLIAKEPPTEGAHRGQHVALAVDDVEVWRRRLLDRGVVCGPVRIRPDGARQVFVNDPDGHVIELLARVDALSSNRE
jgi:catechol 2,3-dioxygenase-like lactoylglutathione lyase family enzyme